MLKFIDQWYIGIKSNKLAFMTPDGTDSAATKRKETVDRWTRGYPTYVDGKPVYTSPNKLKSIKCEALEGFKIGHSIFRGGSYYGSQDKWRIEDPRGFDLEITSKNIEIILAYTTIINGVIQGKCRWAREKANNVLVPEAAPEFQKAAEGHAHMAKEIFQLTDDHIGYHVSTQSTVSGVYMGKYNLVNCYAKKIAKSYHMFMTQDGDLGVIKEPKAVALHARIDGVDSYETADAYIQSVKEKSNKSYWIISGSKNNFCTYAPHMKKIEFVMEDVNLVELKAKHNELKSKYKQYYENIFRTIYIYKDGVELGSVYTDHLGVLRLGIPGAVDGYGRIYGSYQCPQPNKNYQYKFLKEIKIVD